MLPLLNQTLFTRINNIFSKELTRFGEPIVCFTPCRFRNQYVIPHLLRSSVNVSEPNDTDLQADDTCGLWSGFYSSDLLLVHSKCNYGHQKDLVYVLNSVRTGYKHTWSDDLKNITSFCLHRKYFSTKCTIVHLTIFFRGPKNYTGI